MKKDVETVITKGAKLGKMLADSLIENATGRYGDIVALSALAKVVALTVCAQQETGIPFPMEKFMTLLETELEIAKDEFSQE